MARTENGKVALITGGGQGIGQAIAERLYADGFKVAVADLNIETARKVADALGGKQRGALAIQVDVADRDSVFAAVNHAASELGGFDVMINNAGIAPASPIEEITQESIEANLFSAGLPPLDLLIRTSGEVRLSNFLLWQAAYAEMMFVDTLWPDFTPAHLAQALEEFANRERRFGGR